MIENCKDDGTQKNNQLTKRKERGKIEILKRVKSGEIHVSPADKGKWIVVMPLSLYHKMVEQHTRNDEEVSWRKLSEAQKLVRS